MAKEPTGAVEEVIDEHDPSRLLNQLVKGMPRECPRCAADTVLPIVYGYPTPKIQYLAAEGKISPGGCCVGGDDPA